jgi:hypothetical protein
MNRVIHIEKKDVPKIFVGLFGYKGRMYRVEVCTEVELTNNYWSGGTKSDYLGIDLTTGITADPQRSDYGNPFTNPGNTPTVRLVEGKAIVEHSFFCGKDMGLRIYMHPDNVAKLLPAGPELQNDQKIVLCATRSLKSSYGGIKNFRFSEAKRDTRITWERWEKAKAELIAGKYLTRAGAITAKGRNAIGSVSLYQLRKAEEEKTA